MSLVFGALTTDRVNHGADTSLDDLDPFTYLMWVYPTTLTANRALMGKDAGGLNGRVLVVAGTGASSQLQGFVSRATTSSNYVTSLSVLTTDAWHFVGMTFDSGAAAGQIINLYHGLRTTIVAEQGYSISTDGSGAVTSDAANGLCVGNIEDASAAFEGRVAWAGVWNRVLSLGEVRSQQFHPHVTSGCKLFCHYGWNGTGTQPNWADTGSVNNGTVTGATVGAHVPLGPPFAAPEWVPYTVAAPAGGQPTMRRWGGVPGMVPGGLRIGRGWGA